MTMLWTWGGEFFGYRDGENLWTHDGRHVGVFVDDEIFGIDGAYLGEVKNENRLITNRSKSNRRRGISRRLMNRIGIVRHVNYVGNVMNLSRNLFKE